MKAAVLEKLGEAPKYRDFPDPIPQNDDQLVITIKAAAVKNLDKGRASGAHYASYNNLPEVVGVDGVGILADGTRVYAAGITGMIAEKALVAKNRYIKLPAGIDDVTAATLPNAVFGSALALKYRARIKSGDVVLINGATGVTGQAAVQVARYYGAKKIIATGRNSEALQSLLALGADEIISLKQDDGQIIDRIKALHSAYHINIVIDYLWGHPAELILQSLKGGGLHAISGEVRFVTVGSMAGETINLSSGVLRSSAIEILGSGFGSLPAEAMEKFQADVIPEMLVLASKGGLKIETVTAALKDIESAWVENIPAGKRLVILM